MEKLKPVRKVVEDKLRGLPEKGLQYARIRARQQSLEAAHSLLVSRQRETQLYEESPLGYYRFFDAKADQVETSGRTKKLALITIAGGLFGGGLCLAFIALVESFDDRLKTVADAQRATGLPVLARLGDLKSLNPGQQSAWAFRTWMALQSKLASDAERRIVCGLLAASSGEGCSTWGELLGRAASQRETPVIVVTNRPPTEGTVIALEEALRNPQLVPTQRGSLTWIALPPGWTWDGPQRQRWQNAVAAWLRPAGLVLLVELSQAEAPETLLMAETLPQILWLVGAGQARGSQTAERLEPLHHARCHFAGAVLNREQPLFRRKGATA